MRTQCIQVKEMPSSLLQEGICTTPNQSGGPRQPLSYTGFTTIPGLCQTEWNSWPHSRMLSKPSTTELHSQPSFPDILNSF